MAKEVVCPRCGLAVAIDPPEGPAPAAEPIGSRHTVEVMLPVTTVDVGPHFDRPAQVEDATAGPSGGIGVFVAGDAGPRDHPPGPYDLDASNDDLFDVEPDPLLGEFVPPSQDPEAGTEPAIEALDPGHPSPPFGGLDLDAGAPPSHRHADPEEATEDDGDPAGPPIGRVLLVSYASAVTLALGYVLWSHRDRRPTGPETMPADSRPDLGAEGNKALKPAPPIAADRLLTIGQTSRIGGREVTPVGVVDRPVRLVRAGSDAKKPGRAEPGKAPQLRLKIKNTSEVPVAPIDASLVRVPDLGPPETYIESGRGDRIDPYFLATNRYWSIAGQSFKAIDPGSTSEVLIVGGKDARDRLADPLLWRIRLRTPSGGIETVGVRFRLADIR